MRTTIGLFSLLSGCLFIPGSDLEDRLAKPHSAGGDDSPSDTGSPATDPPSDWNITVQLEDTQLYTDDVAQATISTVGDISVNDARFAWVVDDEPVLGVTSMSLDGDLYFDKGQTISVTVTVALDGTEKSATSAQTTILNSAPSMSSTQIIPSTAKVGESLTCTATATDEDEDSAELSITYAWSSGTAGELMTVSADQAPGEEIECTATVTDDEGVTDNLTATATVLNTAPTVEVTVTPEVARVGETLTCNAVGADADDGVLAASYMWSTGTTGETYTVESTDDPGDVITCTATVVDSADESEEGSASATVLNSEAVVDSVEITPDTAYNDSELTCTATATDADGDEPEVTYTWSTGDTGPTITLSNDVASPNDEITCTASVTDGEEDSVPVTAQDSITLTNRVPVVTVTITPDEPTISSTLSCIVSVEDLDFDTIDPDGVTYQWTRDGMVLSYDDTDSYVLSWGGIEKSDVITCTVTAIDEHGGIATGNDSVGICNTPPEFVAGAEAEAGPYPLYTNDVFTVTPNAADVDGDALTYSYAFSVNGEPIAQSPSLNTLDGATHFDKTDVVSVTITASDGMYEDTTDQFYVSGTSSYTGEEVAGGGGDGIMVENTPPTDPPGIYVEQTGEVCTALRFDGEDDYALLDGTIGSIIEPAGDGWTIEAWVRTDAEGDDLADNNRIFGTTCAYFELYLTDDGTLGLWRWGDPTQTFSTTAINDGKWHHIAAVTEDGAGDGSNEYRLYVDGVEEDADAEDDNLADNITPAFYANYFSIGASDSAGCVHEGTSEPFEHFLEMDLLSIRVSDHPRYTEDTFEVEWNGYLENDSHTTLLYNVGAEEHDRFTEQLIYTQEDDSEVITDVEGPEWTDDCQIGMALTCIIDGVEEDPDGDPIHLEFSWTFNGEPFDGAGTFTHPGDMVPSSALTESGDWTCSAVVTDDWCESVFMQDLFDSCEEYEIDCTCDDNGPEASDTVYFELCAELSGERSSCPAEDCLQIMEQGHSVGDGLYWVDPEGDGESFQVYCDMTTDGGGWSMAFSNRMAPGDHDLANLFLSDEPADDVEYNIDEPIISAARRTIPMTELMLRFNLDYELSIGPEEEWVSIYRTTAGPITSIPADSLFVIDADRSTNHLHAGGCEGSGTTSDSILFVNHTGALHRNYFFSQGYDDIWNQSGLFCFSGEHCLMSSESEGGLFADCTPGFVTDQSWAEVYVRNRDLCEDQFGATEECPGLSCLDILEEGSASDNPDGVYWIDPTGEGAFQAYCDMTNDGGGWTRVAYAPEPEGGAVMNTPEQVNPAGCLDGENIFCKMSDARINELIDAFDGTDDRFRFTHSDDPEGRYFWNTTSPFSHDNNDESSDWWKVSLSIGGDHSPGCKHPSSRGLGHYPSDISCTPYGTFETQLFHSGLEYTGSPNPALRNFGWWVR